MRETNDEFHTPTQRTKGILDYTTGRHHIGSGRTTATDDLCCKTKAKILVFKREKKSDSSKMSAPAPSEHVNQLICGTVNSA
jgi:hypothetical protein